MLELNCALFWLYSHTRLVMFNDPCSEKHSPRKNIFRQIQFPMHRYKVRQFYRTRNSYTWITKRVNLKGISQAGDFWRFVTRFHLPLGGGWGWWMRTTRTSFCVNRPATQQNLFCWSMQFSFFICLTFLIIIFVILLKKY